MKRSFLILAAAFGLGIGSASSEVHRFTSADGQKTLDATLVGYDATKGTIQIRPNGGRTITAPLSAFSEEDAKYVKESSQRLAISRNLWVDIKSDESETSETKSTTAKTKKLTSGFKVKFMNNSFVPMDGVQAKYRIFYNEDQAKGGKVAKVKDGTINLDELSPQQAETHETASVELVKVRPVPQQGST